MRSDKVWMLAGIARCLQCAFCWLLFLCSSFPSSTVLIYSQSSRQKKQNKTKQTQQQVREAESTFWTSLQTCTIIVGQTVLGLAHISSCRPLLVERKVAWLTTWSVCSIQNRVNYTEVHKIRMKWLPVLWFHSNCMQTWLQTSGSGFDWPTADCVHCCLTLRWGLLIRNKKQVIHSSVILDVLRQEGLLVKLFIHYWVKWYWKVKTRTVLAAKCSNQVCVEYIYSK